MREPFAIGLTNDVEGDRSLVDVLTDRPTDQSTHQLFSSYLRSVIG